MEGVRVDGEDGGGGGGGGVEFGHVDEAVVEVVVAS